MSDEYKPVNRRIPIASFGAAILATGAGSLLTQPWSFGGFQVGMFLAWIAMPILAAVVVTFEMTELGGDA